MALTTTEQQQLLELHCTDTGTRLMKALDALGNLSADERKAVLAAHRKGSTQPVTTYMEKYRVALARNLAHRHA